MLPDMEKKRKLMKILGDDMADYLAQSSPAAPDFQPQGLYFPVGGTRNDGILQILCPQAGQLSLTLGVYRRGTDRMYTHYLCSAAPEEVIAYLREPANRETWLTLLESLSARADED